MAPNNYKDLCINLVRDTIKNNTRFTLKDDFLNSYKDFDFDFKVGIHNKLTITTYSTTKYGLKHAKNSDELYEDYILQEEAAEIQREEEEENPKHFEYLKERIQNGKYALFSEHTRLYQIKKRFLYEYRCEDCKGNGKVVCDECRGKGEIKCTRCKGGTIQCGKCDGTGKNQKEK